MRQLPAGRFLLGYLLLVTLVITLAPFRFTRPVAPHLSWLVDPGDVVANVLLFVAPAALELLRGFHPAHGASALVLLFTGVVGLYGGLLYRMQLAVVRETAAARAP